jgi:exodeoxyribonuclease V alpha subunit
MMPPVREAPGWLPPLAGALAEALPRLHGAAADPLVGEVIAALLLALEAGEVELSLAGPPPPMVSRSQWPEGHRRALCRSPLAAGPDGPLVLLDDRLLWRRWHERRRAVLDDLLRRAQPIEPPPPEGEEPCPDPAAADPRLDAQQRLAVAAALRHGLVLLEGGPGTGKTSTVAAMLAAERQRRPGARLQLAAPTGKAAARLRAATGDRWPCSTLHRLLESRGGRFGRHRRRPLPLDLLVVDEVSMVDLELMEALLEALPLSCRLVLVGDPAQLPPVSPGAVVPELRRPELHARLGAAAVTLATTYRNAGMIAAVAAELRAAIEASPTAGPGPGDHDLDARIAALLDGAPAESNLHRVTAAARRPPPLVRRRLERHRRDLATAAQRCERDPGTWRELLRQRDRLLVLAPLRRGPWGLEVLHRLLLGRAMEAPLIRWPVGTPVLCRRNLPDLGLANGDVGVLVGAAAADDATVIFGEAAAAAPLRVHPAQLSGAVEPAFALTVHKAQGSEADEVIVLLPEAAGDDPRLLYTALTRARRQALLIVPEEGPPLTNDEALR